MRSISICPDRNIARSFATVAGTGTISMPVAFLNGSYTVSRFTSSNTPPGVRTTSCWAAGWGCCCLCPSFTCSLSWFFVSARFDEFKRGGKPPASEPAVTAWTRKSGNHLWLAGAQIPFARAPASTDDDHLGGQGNGFELQVAREASSHR